MRFSAVVGQQDLKLALLLTSIDPRIGGVLLRGEKGSGKTTLVRALADLLPGQAPFVELPLGATEDRVLGSIDLGAALAGEGEVVRPGLLAAADGGVLFVDELNLLADHLVDTLLDVAVSGVHRLERDGVSATLPARFVLVGTMNPEEGELRPQLLDRFGLCAQVVAPRDPAERAEVVRRRLAVDAGTVDPSADADDDHLRARLATARPAALDDAVIDYAARLAVAAEVEGLRADVVLCRAAAALAGWEERDSATIDDVARVAHLVLAHRRRRHPFDPPGLDPGELDDLLDRARDEPPPPDPPGHEGDADDDTPQPDDHRPDPAPDDHRPDEEAGNTAGAGEAPARGRPVVLGAEQAASARARTVVSSPRGRHVRDHERSPGSGEPIAVVGTVRALARRRVDDPSAAPTAADLRVAERVETASTLLVICLDTSGSMGAAERIALATGTALGALSDAYRRRDRVALVTFGSGGAAVALTPTTSVEIARNRLADMRTGGPTPLAEGLRTTGELIDRARRPDEPVHLVLITDGRASGGEQELDAALAAGDEIRRRGVTATVIDTETGHHRLGLAQLLAERLDAELVRPESTTASTAASTDPRS